MKALIIVAVIVGYIICAAVTYEVLQHESQQDDCYDATNLIMASAWPAFGIPLLLWGLIKAIAWVPRQITRRILK